MNSQEIIKLRDKIAEVKPIIFHITNYVTVNDCANITLASNVPTCSATSNDSGIFPHPKSHGNKFKWAELDTGKNSVNPCIIPKTID